MSVVSLLALIASTVADRPIEHTQIAISEPISQLQLTRASSERAASPGLAKGNHNAATNISHRADLCSRLNEVSAGKRSLEKGLLNAHLTVVAPMPGNAYLHKDSNGNFTGYDFEVMKALAKLGTFTFDILEVPLKYSHSDDEFMEMNKKYDVVIEHNSELFLRDSLKISPVFGNLDSSLALVTTRDPSAGRFRRTLQQMAKVVYPFESWVWLAFTACCISTGVLYWIIEPPDEDAVDINRIDLTCRESVALSVYDSFMHFTTVINFSPKTWPGRILVVSWTILSIVFLAAYTANLATILVMDQQIGRDWLSIDDVMNAEGRICVNKGSSGGKYMTGKYPDYMHTIVVQEYPIKSMVEGKCDAAIVWQQNYEVSLLQQEYNPHCRMDRIGGLLTTSKGGWTVFADYHERCTVLVRDVLHMFFQHMAEDGTLESLYSQKLLRAETTLKTSCTAPTVGQSSLGLKIQDMLGLFLLHFLGAALACTIFLCYRPRGGCTADAGDSD